jgi:hypothetical protein
MAEAKKDPAAQPTNVDFIAAIEALARSLKPQGPLEMAGLTPERIAEITQPPKPQRYRDIPWRSEETGATGIAHVVESKGKAFPNGRIVSISGYTHPPEAYIFQSQEGPTGKPGMVPDGFPIWSGHARTIPEGQEPQQGDLNQGFLQWRYETFYRADLRFYIGREIKAHHCAEEGPDQGLKTPWQASKVGAVSEAA